MENGADRLSVYTDDDWKILSKFKEALPEKLLQTASRPQSVHGPRRPLSSDASRPKRKHAKPRSVIRPQTASLERTRSSSAPLHWSDIRNLQRPLSAKPAGTVQATQMVFFDRGEVHHAEGPTDRFGLQRHGLVPEWAGAGVQTTFGARKFRSELTGPDPKDVGPGWDDTPSRPSTAGHTKAGLRCEGRVDRCAWQSSMADRSELNVRQTSLGPEASSGILLVAENENQLTARGPMGLSSTVLSATDLADARGARGPNDEELRKWQAEVTKELKLSPSRSVSRPISASTKGGAMKKSAATRQSQTAAYTRSPKLGFSRRLSKQCRDAQDELDRVRMQQYGSKASVSTVQKTLDAEKAAQAAKGRKGSAAMQNAKTKTYQEPEDYKQVIMEIAPDYKQPPAVKAKNRAKQIDLEEKAYFKSLRHLFEKGGIRLTAKKVILATETFKKLSPAQTSIDMNQIDIIMRKLGVHDPFLCHQVFSCFDTDGDRTVDFREFIWGLSMIYKAPLAESFQNMWSKMSMDERFAHMDLDGDGTLCFEELSLMFCQAGCITDRDLLSACVNKLFYKLDIDNSGTIDYEEFRINLITDSVVEKIFRAVLLGEGVEQVAKMLNVRYTPDMVREIRPTE